jgi:hypothetical protein
MPAGWQRYMVDDEGKRLLTAAVSARMKELGRPDLDVQMRLLIQSQWRQLGASKVSAVYLPGKRDDDLMTPASIAVKQYVGAPGRDFEASVRAMVTDPVERFDTPIGPILRWVGQLRGKDEMSTINSRQVGYAIPLPGGNERRGLLFLAAVPFLDETDPRMVDALTELCDTIMETFRWR